MLGNPKIGDTYHQEYYKGKAEDMAEVLSLTESVSVPYCDFVNCLQTKEWSPLESGITEHKYYAPGIGLLLEKTVEGGSGQNRLVNITIE